MKLKKSAKKTIIIVAIILVVLLLAGMGYLAYKRFFSEGANTGKPVVVSQIKEYGYSLEKDASTPYKKLYDELSDVLQEEEIDDEAYAKLVAQMLVIDFYNLDNKISKNDIGGVQFLKEDVKANFTLEASETVYKYIEHNIYGDRTQKLPVILETTIKSINQTTYKYKTIEDANAYKVIVGVTYEEDMGYPKEVTVVLVHNEKKLEVIKMY